MSCLAFVIAAPSSPFSALTTTALRRSLEPSLIILFTEGGELLMVVAVDQTTCDDMVRLFQPSFRAGASFARLTQCTFADTLSRQTVDCHSIYELPSTPMSRVTLDAWPLRHRLYPPPIPMMVSDYCAHCSVLRAPPSIACSCLDSGGPPLRDFSFCPLPSARSGMLGRIGRFLYRHLIDDPKDSEEHTRRGPGKDTDTATPRGPRSAAGGQASCPTKPLPVAAESHCRATEDHIRAKSSYHR